MGNIWAGYFYSYWLYLVIVGPALLFSLFAQIRVKSSFNKYSRIASARGLTGANAAMQILNFYGIHDVQIEHIRGKLSDHYDPKAKTIRLSDAVFSSNSVAAIGVACHEAGHAAQHAENYAPIKFRNAIIPVCNIGSTLGIPVALIGMFLNSGFLINLGLAMYSLIAVFQFVTLPVEFNASRRAIDVIEQAHIMEGEELTGAKRVLTAAALTYVAALATSIANLLRLIILFNRGNNRR